MENAAEALKMFFAVFVFSLALSVFFRMTSVAKDTTDKIFEAIYRYAKVGFGVTIIDSGEIVARFDLDTESQVSSCFWNDRYHSASQIEKKKSNDIKAEICKYLNDNIISKVNSLEPNITSMTNLDENSLDILI